MRASSPLLLALLGCSSGSTPAPDATPAAPPPPSVQLSRVGVRDTTPPDRRPAPIPAAELERSLADALGAAGLERGQDPKGWRVGLDARVTYGVTTGDGISATPVAGTAKAAWGIEVALKPPGELVAEYAYVEVSAEIPFDGAPGALPDVLRAQVVAAASKAARAVATRANLLNQPVANLLRALEDDDPELRRAAVGRLGALRAKEAVEPLAARMRVEKDRTTVLRMIGALQEIGDDAAANALISLAQPRDREMLRAIVDALSVIGGERVRDFFDVLDAHDSPEVRDMVARARARLKRGKR